MKVVGDLFGSGQMQLPLRAAKRRDDEGGRSPISKSSWSVSRAKARARIVLATVKGDVHDIGKNLVDIILTNNGYTVYNLGIKQPIADILKTAAEKKADAVGMSGLLVKSVNVMRENLEEMNARGISRSPSCSAARRLRAIMPRTISPSSIRDPSSIAKMRSRACT